MRNSALKNLRERKRRGFTLVELLIVIIIIGILAGAMLMVAGSGTDKAEATKIVSDLRTLKSAALMYYADKGKWPSGAIDTVLGEYMDRKISSDMYGLTTNGEAVFFKKVVPNSGIAKKLAEMARGAGLYDADLVTDYPATKSNVYMRVSGASVTPIP